MKVLYEVQSDVSQISNDFHCYSARFSPKKGDYTIFAGSSDPHAMRIYEKIQNNYKYIFFFFNFIDILGLYRILKKEFIQLMFHYKIILLL